MFPIKRGKKETWSFRSTVNSVDHTWKKKGVGKKTIMGRKKDVKKVRKGGELGTWEKA